MRVFVKVICALFFSVYFHSRGWQKIFRSRTSTSTYFFSLLIINDKSSVYCEMLSCFCPHGRVIPLSLPSATTFFIMYVRASPTMRNRFGASAHPCLTLRSTLNAMLGLPFKLTEGDVFLKSNPTHLMNLALTFILCIVICLRKIYLQENRWLLWCFGQCKISCVKTMLSKMNRSGRNVVCSRLITLRKIGWNLSSRALAKIL